MAARCPRACPHNNRYRSSDRRVELVRFGGSWYYLLAGFTLLVSASFLLKRRFVGIGIFATLFVTTVVWSGYEAGLDYWQWVPRLGLLLILAILNALITPTLAVRTRLQVPFTIAGILGLVFVGGFAMAFVPHGVIEGTAPVAAREASSAATEGNWSHYGKDAQGTRYAPYGQITKENVDQLQVAGELCASFGDHGTIALNEGMGPYIPGIYSPTSVGLLPASD